jgi:YD repeat-containing protein
MNEHNQVVKSTNGAGGTTTKTYDDLGNLGEINAIESAGTAMDYSYTWDRTNGNLLNRTSTPGLKSTNPALAESFTYDNLDRLQNANINGIPTPATYNTPQN